MNTKTASRRTAAVSVAAAASNAIIAAPGTNKRIVVLGYSIFGAAAVNGTWEDSGGTDLAGIVPLATGSRWVGSDECPAFILPVNVGLNLLLSGAVQVSGHVTYVILGE